MTQEEVDALVSAHQSTIDYRVQIADAALRPLAEESGIPFDLLRRLALAFALYPLTAP